MPDTTWVCNSCGWVNTIGCKFSRNRVCQECGRRKGADAVNVAFEAMPMIHGRQRLAIEQDKNRKVVEVQTWADGTAW